MDDAQYRVSNARTALELGCVSTTHMCSALVVSWSVTHTHTHTHIHTQTHTQTHTHKLTHKHTRTHTHTNTHAHIHTHTHAANYVTQQATTHFVPTQHANVPPLVQGASARH